MNRTYESVPGDLAELRGTSAQTTRPLRNGPAVDALDDCPPYLRDLNVAQRAAARYGAPDAGPLLVIAGAGTGKTNTLAHRVAHLILTGTLPERILLLTFTRRAASEMTRRAERILAAARTASKARGSGPSGEITWSGTFHAIGNRLLRDHANNIGLDPSFTVLDRADAEDRLNLVRSDLGLAKSRRDSRGSKPASPSIRIA